MNNLLRGAVVSLVAIASVLTAPAALAAPDDGTCTYGEVCAFLHQNYGGGMDDVASADSHWNNNYFSSGVAVHDATSSGFAVERAARFWVDVNFAGPHFTLGINQYDPLWSTNQPNATSASYNFNDKIDSNALYIP